MAQGQDANGNDYRASGWLGVITAGKLWTDFRLEVDDDALIQERTDALLLEIANKLNISEYCI